MSEPSRTPYVPTLLDELMCDLRMAEAATTVTDDPALLVAIRKRIREVLCAKYGVASDEPKVSA